MTTRKSVDEILDVAADILEQSGWVTDACYDDKTGGHCAIGAVARAVYPKATNDQIGDLAYLDQSADEYLSTTGRKKDPRHVEAMDVLARTVARRKNVADPTAEVFTFNDSFDSGVDREWDYVSDEYTVTVDEKVRLRSAKKVVAKLRLAAEKYRKAQAV